MSLIGIIKRFFRVLKKTETEAVDFQWIAMQEATWHVLGISHLILNQLLLTPFCPSEIKYTQPDFEIDFTIKQGFTSHALIY